MIILNPLYVALITHKTLARFIQKNSNARTSNNIYIYIYIYSYLYTADLVFQNPCKRQKTNNIKNKDRHGEIALMSAIFETMTFCCVQFVKLPRHNVKCQAMKCFRTLTNIVDILMSNILHITSTWWKQRLNPCNGS